MKILIYLFTFFFYFQYFANSQSLELEYKISKPPLCKNNNGNNVYFKNLNSKTGMFPAGVAKKDINGLPVIYRFNYQKAPKSLQIFIDFMNVPIIRLVIWKKNLHNKIVLNI